MELSLGKNEKVLKLSCYEQVLQNQAISQLCETGQLHFKYISTKNTTFSIWLPNWRLTYFCMHTKESFYLRKEISVFHLKYLEVWFLKYFPTEINVTKSLWLWYSTNTHMLSPKNTRAMASSKSCPMLSGAVLSLGLALQSTHQPLPKRRNKLRENPRKLRMTMFFFAKETHIHPDLPHKKSKWSWWLSAEWFKNSANTILYFKIAIVNFIYYKYIQHLQSFKKKIAIFYCKIAHILLYSQWFI